MVARSQKSGGEFTAHAALRTRQKDTHGQDALEKLHRRQLNNAIEAAKFMAKHFANEGMPRMTNVHL